jgi:hypothetical protein
METTIADPMPRQRLGTPHNRRYAGNQPLAGLTHRKKTEHPTTKMNTPPIPPRRRFSSRWPFHDLTTPSEIEIEARLSALRARHPGAKIEVHRIEHDPACNLNDGRACDCQPMPVVIVDGHQWLRLLADGSEEPAAPPAPKPNWLDCEEEPHLLALVLPVADMLRVQVCQHVVTTIGEGSTARFIGGEVIDAALTRALRRRERHHERRPLIPA